MSTSDHHRWASRRELKTVALVIAGVLLHWNAMLTAQTILIDERFENSSFSSRGWYDGSGGSVSTAEKFNGSGAFECRFQPGTTRCSGGAPGRHKFAETDSVYASFYVKHSANWVGSGRSYHPHLFLFMTNKDGDYVGPAYTHLTAYIEENNARPVFIIQDGRNIDETKIGVDLTGVTEQRSVAGCNGDSDGYGKGGCYQMGSVHWNDKWWRTSQVYFDSTPGTPNYKGNWHLVEAYFRLNTIVNGKAARDGVIRYWYDGVLIMDHSDIVLRTGANGTMRFNQLQFVPYIGDGSPADQVIWFDSLFIATARPAAPPVPPSQPGAPPRPPTNLRIIR